MIILCNTDDQNKTLKILVLVLGIHVSIGLGLGLAQDTCKTFVIWGKKKMLRVLQCWSYFGLGLENLILTFLPPV